MTEYITNDAELKSVADAIRAKTGKTDPLTFPTEFASEIAGIESGGTDTLEERLSDAMTEYSNDQVTSIIQNGMSFQTKLISVSLPNVTDIGANAFYGCSALKNIYFPKLTTISASSFGQCKSITEFITNEHFNSRIDTRTFEGCDSLLKADFYHINSLGISAYAFSCMNLETLIFRNTDFVPNMNVNAFGAIQSKMNTGQGYIYVYRSVIDQYKVATNWAKYADQIRAIEDYPEITGG